MGRIASLLVLASAAVHAQATTLTAPAVTIDMAPVAALRQPVSLVLDPALCDTSLQPASWRDASDALLFAAGPLQQLSADDRAFQHLRALAELRLTLGSLQFVALGAPVQTWGRLQLLPSSGWRLAGC